MFLDEFGVFKGDFDVEGELIGEIMSVSSKFASCNREIYDIEVEIEEKMHKLQDLKAEKEELQDKMNVLNAKLREIKGKKGE